MSVWKDKVVIVTGGSDGIGKALVELFLDQGAKVATCARNNDKLYQLQLGHPDKPLMIYTADISKEGECKSFVDAVVRDFNKIDVLVNNAGISMRSLFSDVSLDAMRKVMDVNFWGTVYCTKFALPYIKNAKGTVAAVSSIAGYRGLPGRSGYSASKFALNGWMESLRTEMLGTGVNVLWVSPGFTATNIRQAALNSEGKPQGESPIDEATLMSSIECASRIMLAIEKKKRSVVMTSLGIQAVLLNKIFPSLADRLTQKMYFKNGALVK